MELEEQEERKWEPGVGEQEPGAGEQEQEERKWEPGVSEQGLGVVLGQKRQALWRVLNSGFLLAQNG